MDGSPSLVTCVCKTQIRTSTLEVMEAVKTWRRSKLCMKLPFVLRGRNYLIKMITGTIIPHTQPCLSTRWVVSGQQSRCLVGPFSSSSRTRLSSSPASLIKPKTDAHPIRLGADLDFVHRHELVLKALGHPMRCNPFILHHTTLCPDPFRGHHAKQPPTGNRKAPPPVPEVNETVGESDLARIQDHEKTLLAELRFTGTVLRPPSPRQLMAWAQGPQSSLPDDGDVKLRSRELLGMEKRINTVQVNSNITMTQGFTH